MKLHHVKEPVFIISVNSDVCMNLDTHTLETEICNIVVLFYGLVNKSHRIRLDWLINIARTSVFRSTSIWNVIRTLFPNWGGGLARNICQP